MRRLLRILHWIGQLSIRRNSIRYVCPDLKRHYLTFLGDQCFCGNEIPPPNPGTCDRPCRGDIQQLCGSNEAMSVFVIVFRSPSTPITGPVESTTSTSSASSVQPPAPSSTGDPVCGPNNAFDGTVNNNFLILCDTTLSGSEINVVTASSLAECISDCRSYPPESQRVCVAVEYSVS